MSPGLLKGIRYAVMARVGSVSLERSMIPELHRVGHKAALLVQPLRSGVAPLGHYRHPSQALRAEPAQRLREQRPSRSLTPVRRAHREQSDLTLVPVGPVARYVPYRQPTQISHDHRVRIPVAALVDPRFEQRVAL